MASTSTTTMATMATTTHPAVFSTRTQYPLPAQKYMIPSSWRRYQLSQLVNKALSLPLPKPFDFLLRGEIIRGTLSEWCSEHGVGEEETLEIEYIESVLPPEKMSEIPHEEWVSAVSCQIPGHFLTTAYDGHVRLFDYSRKLIHDSQVHNAPISALALFTTPSDPDEYIVASASHDMTAVLTQLSLPTGTTTKASTKALASLHLHTAPLSSISSNANGTHLLTSSWDGLIGLWDTTIPEEDEVTPDEPLPRSSKRRKVAAQGDAERYGTRKAPSMVLKSHTARVSGAVFAATGDDPKYAYSCGFDSTVRLWDTELGVSVHTVTCSSKPFLSLVSLPTSSISSSASTVLVSSTDRTVSLYDLRLPSSTDSISNAALLTFSHPATPRAIALSPSSSTPSSSSPSESSPHRVLTGSYDGIARLWDLRSAKGAVASFKAWQGANAEANNNNHKKILGVDWGRGGVLGVAGEGGVEVWRVREDAGLTLDAQKVV